MYTFRTENSELYWSEPCVLKDTMTSFSTSPGPIGFRWYCISLLIRCRHSIACTTGSIYSYQASAGCRMIKVFNHSLYAIHTVSASSKYTRKILNWIMWILRCNAQIYIKFGKISNKITKLVILIIPNLAIRHLEGRKVLLTLLSGNAD